MKKVTKLFEVNLNDFGESIDWSEKLSNVVIIGYDTSHTLTFINELDPESLDKGEQLDIVGVCEEIIQSLTLLKKNEPCTLGDTERKQTEGKKLVADSIEYNSPYEATVEGMLSPDYKERFKAEYQQTKIRYEKLKAFNTRIEAAQLTRDMKSQCEEPKHDCPAYLIRDQEETMGRYLHILEVRAVIEGIEL